MDWTELYKKVVEIIEVYYKEENGQEIIVNQDTKLFGSKGILDSMSLVSIIVEIEELLQEDYGWEILLSNEKAFSRRTSPFLKVSFLIDYIKELYEESK